MDGQVKTVVCPNCGANTKNYHNCEYCGSLLVRYAAENKEVDKTVFGDTVPDIPGLKEELKKNISYQKIKKEGDVVVTTVTDSQGLMFQVIETANCNIGTMANNPFAGQYERGVSLRVTFETRNEDSDFAENERIRLNWFKQQDFYFLFTQQNLPVGVYYYIDFGEDIDNATKLISSIMAVSNGKNGTYSFDTKMINPKSYVSDGGLIVDTTKRKAKIAMTVTTIICVVIYILFNIV